MRNEVFVYLEIYSVYLEIYEYGEVVQGVRFPDEGLVESHLMLKNNCLCFRMSSSFVGNNHPSLQIYSFSEDRGKCNQTCNPSISDFSTNLTSDILILADSSQAHLPSDEAYRQCLTLPCNCFNGRV